MHKHMNLTHKHFNNMKYQLLEELCSMGLPIDHILLSIWRYETLRTTITNKKSMIEIIGDQNGI